MIAFNKPFLTGKELHYISQAHEMSKLSGDGLFSKKCHSWLEANVGCDKALLTHSCTAALEMAAILSGIAPGDEVIMPSYTFVSTANAFVLRGAIPVFVDIKRDTLNLDEKLIESAITKKTKAIVPVHYAGVACEMDVILEIASKNRLVVIEDAAQGICATYKGRPLGSIGNLGCYSFHETKNIISGEGGALIINDGKFSERSEIIREKGTNRNKFFRGEVDKYNWVDIGSSFLPGEIVAAFLWAQMEEVEKITNRRMALWNIYHDELERFELIGRVRRPIIPPNCVHNAHMYYLILSDESDRAAFIDHMKLFGINCVFHYSPLHSSPYGIKAGRSMNSLPVTTNMANRIVRLPMWIGLQENGIAEVIKAIKLYLDK